MYYAQKKFCVANWKIFEMFKVNKDVKFVYTDGPKADLKHINQIFPLQASTFFHRRRKFFFFRILAIYL